MAGSRVIEYDDRVLHLTDHLAIVAPLIVGAAIIAATIFVHAVALAGVVRFVRHMEQIGAAGSGFFKNVGITSQVALLMFAAHLVEIAMWALVFLACGEFGNFAVAFYRSAGDYTTLGSGNLPASLTWRMLEPLEATNGMLLFGLSTAILFAVVHRLIQSHINEPNIF